MKKEKIVAECQLAVALEELEDTQETLGQQAIFTDAWQGCFDELALLAEGAGVDKVLIQAIRYRYVSGKKHAWYEWSRAAFTELANPWAEEIEGGGLWRLYVFNGGGLIYARRTILSVRTTSQVFFLIL